MGRSDEKEAELLIAVRNWLAVNRYPGLVVTGAAKEKPRERHPVFAGLCLRCGSTTLALSPFETSRRPWYFTTVGRDAVPETEGYVMFHEVCLPRANEEPDDEPVWLNRALRDV